MSSRKPPSSSGDWDDFDIPTWDDSVPSKPQRGSSSSSSQRSSSGSSGALPDPLYDDYDTSVPPSRQSSRPGSTGQPPSRLSSRVPTHTTRPSRDPYRDPYSGYDDAYAVDPYDPEPQYEPQEPPRSAAASQYDLYADPALDSGWEGAAAGYADAPATRRGRSGRQRTRAPRPSLNIARPAISDSTLAGIVGIAVLGLIGMIGVVWWGIGDLTGVIPWHLNASGDVDGWVSDSSLWRIPFGVFMSLAIGLVLGVFLWKRDRFAARFIVSSMCIVQVLAWVAVIDQLW